MVRGASRQEKLRYEMEVAPQGKEWGLDLLHPCYMLRPSRETKNMTEKPALTDGFRLLIKALKLNGVKVLYGVPGIPITDFARLAQASGIRVLSFRHEQSAGNAAAAAGFLTKRPGICLTVSAPGFLNGLTALAHATTNCWPMILLSGSSEREIVDLMQGDYEEMDQLAIAKPLCKAAYRILNAEDIGIGIARAIRAAVSGRPGGVYLDIPGKLLSQTLDAAEGEKSLVKVIDPAPAQIPSAESVLRALDVLKNAKKPLIILGKGAAYAQADDAIREFVEKSGAPYLPMSMAKGLLPDDHPQSAAAARSLALKEADSVVLVGARLNWLLAHGKGAAWGHRAARNGFKRQNRRAIGRRYRFVRLGSDRGDGRGLAPRPRKMAGANQSQARGEHRAPCRQIAQQQFADGL